MKGNESVEVENGFSRRNLLQGIAGAALAAGIPRAARGLTAPEEVGGGTAVGSEYMAGDSLAMDTPNCALPSTATPAPLPSNATPTQRSTFDGPYVFEALTAWLLLTTNSNVLLSSATAVAANTGITQNVPVFSTYFGSVTDPGLIPLDVIQPDGSTQTVQVNRKAVYELVRCDFQTFLRQFHAKTADYAPNLPLCPRAFEVFRSVSALYPRSPS